MKACNRSSGALGAAAVGAILAAALAGCGGGSDNNSNADRGQLLERVDVTALTATQIDQLSTAGGMISLVGAARCDVRLQRLSYLTIGARGESGATASAALMIPSGANCPGPYPLVAYDHGTDVIKATTLASTANPEAQVLIATLAAQGYAVVAPDYLGYASSNYSYHPYLHADSEASVTIDALRAARLALIANQTALKSQILLTGYSQGGHASMATQRAIEAQLADEFTIGAAGHMSGPYNLSGTLQLAVSVLPTGTGGSSIFVPFALTSYQKVYGGLYDDPSRYFKAPYATDIDSLLPGTLTTTELVTQGKLPQLLGDLITDQFVTDINTAGTPLRQRLDENTLLSWTPRSPMLLCGGQRDPVVPWRNAADAQAAFAARGVTVSTVDVEQVPAFAALFPATLSSTQLAAYHAATVPPLCLTVVRDQLFAAVKAQP